MTNDPFDFSDLEVPADQISVRKPGEYATKKFECESCNGTGFWKGGTNRHHNNKCNACAGRGYFVTSKADREKKNFQRKASARAKLETLIEVFKEQEPVMFADLRVARASFEGNGFIRSLAEQLFTKGTLSEKQIAAFHRGKERFEQIKAERQAEAVKAQVSVDLGPIRSMFETAFGNGLKRPTYRAEGLVINRAPDTGANPGALYVKDLAGEYMGKVIGTTFHPVRYAGDTAGALAIIAANPLEVAIAYGRETGSCACCGRTLTDPKSVELGIGPICKDKWGF